MEDNIHMILLKVLYVTITKFSHDFYELNRNGGQNYKNT